MSLTKPMTRPYSRLSYGISAALMLIGLLTLLVPPNVLAVPKGPGGQTCKSSGTTTVNGKEEGTGKDMKCTADYCKYDECQTSGPNIGKCYEKTSYSNVRDCTAAAQTQVPQNHITPGQRAPLMQGQPKRPPQRAPGFRGGAIRRRGVEGEQPAVTEPEGQTDSAPAQSEPAEETIEKKSP